MKKLCLGGCHNPIQISSFPPQIFAKKQKNDLARFKKTKELVTFTLAAEVYSIPNMSVLKNNTQKPKNESSPTSDDSKKVEGEAAVSPPPSEEAAKKKRKLNDGSSTKVGGEKVDFLTSVSNFFSGTWFWRSSMPANTGASKSETSKADGASKKDKTQKGESAKPAETNERTKEKEVKKTDDKLTTKKTSTDSDKSDDADVANQSDNDADGKVESPKAEVVSEQSKGKKRQLS